MKQFKEAKAQYHAVPVPDELGMRVQTGIREGMARNRRRKLRRVLSSSVAACFAVVFTTLNTVPAFAAAAAEFPVLGGLFEVLTIRDDHTKENQVYYNITVPEIQNGGDLGEQVNQEVQTIVNRHIAEMTEMWEDYCAAFLATGGTQEELEDRSMDVTVDYQIMSHTDSMVSLIVDLSQCSFSASQTQYYYNLDLANDRELTLEDLLGEHWVALCNQSILEQIEASKDEDGFTFFFSAEDGGFVTVDTETTFYIREDGVPVVTFPKYSIAAGAAGIPEFPICVDA